MEVDLRNLTFLVSGRKKTFSGKELIVILEEYFDISATTPTEGKCFDVNPKAIDQNLFKENRLYGNEEWKRKVILEAFEEVNRHPEKYAEPFKTYIPKKDWKDKTAEEYEEFAEKLGGHLADQVEQALEWAQRIANGEPWSKVCAPTNTEGYNKLSNTIPLVVFR